MLNNEYDALHACFIIFTSIQPQTITVTYILQLLSGLEVLFAENNRFCRRYTSLSKSKKPYSGYLESSRFDMMKSIVYSALQ